MEKSQSKLGENRAASTKCDVVVEKLIKDHLPKWFLEHSDDDRVDDIDGDEKTTNTSTDLLTKPDDIEVTGGCGCYSLIHNNGLHVRHSKKNGRCDDVLAEK